MARTTPKRARMHYCALLLAIVGIGGAASTAVAHDFWLIPDMFGVAGNTAFHVSGRSGLRFPNGSPVQPARVADARIIGASAEAKITEMTVEGTSLRLHQKPAAAGQYLIVASLMPRTTRAAPAGLIRYLKAEGGAGEAARLERDNVLAVFDTVTYTGASYATTIVQVGTGGPRAFSKMAGFPLEFVALNDPAHLHLGDTLHAKVVGRGAAVSGISIDATPANDSGAVAGAAPVNLMVSLTADANGVVHVPLSKAGPWMLRSAFVSKRLGGAANEWDVSRSTYVFNVGTKH